MSVDATAVALQVEKELLHDLPKEDLFPYCMTVAEHKALLSAANAISDALAKKNYKACPSYAELETLDKLLPNTSHLHHLLHDHVDTKIIGAHINIKHNQLDKHKHSDKHHHLLEWLHERVQPLVDVAQAVAAYMRVRKAHSEYFEMAVEVRFFLRESTRKPRWIASSNPLLVVC